MIISALGSSTGKTKVVGLLEIRMDQPSFLWDQVAKLCKLAPKYEGHTGGTHPVAPSPPSLCRDRSVRPKLNKYDRRLNRYAHNAHIRARGRPAVPPLESSNGAPHRMRSQRRFLSFIGETPAAGMSPMMTTDPYVTYHFFQALTLNSPWCSLLHDAAA